MKKLLLFLFLFSQSLLIGQTILNSSVLNLNKPIENGQLLSAENERTHEVYVFASDNKSITILKYNKSLFLANQFKDTIRVEKNKTLMGYSLNENGNPTLYWESPNRKNLQVVQYNMETKTSKTTSFDFPANTGTVITSFQKNNKFYLLSKEKDQEHFLLFEFSDEKCDVKLFDFSPFTFQNEKGQRLSFSALVQYHYPIEKMDIGNFSPFDKTEKKSKMYVLNDRIVLTFDYNTKYTQAFDLNLNTKKVTEKIFEMPVTQLTATTNSFFLENKLFQISSNTEQFIFGIQDFDSGKNIKTIAVSKNDSISFKNSPLFLQINGEKPQILKSTSKFLKQLSTVNSAVSAFNTNGLTFITLGGFASYQSVGMSFNYGSNDSFNNIQSNSKMVFFDSYLNSDLEFIKNNQAEPLAIDNLHYFLSKTKNFTLENILKVKDFYILGYYDLPTKSYIMRKFTDGFMDEGTGNSIINRAEFSKSIPLK